MYTLLCHLEVKLVAVLQRFTGSHCTSSQMSKRSAAWWKIFLQGEILFTNILLKISFKYLMCVKVHLFSSYISICYPSLFFRTTDNIPSPTILPAVIILLFCKGGKTTWLHSEFCSQNFFFCKLHEIILCEFKLACKNTREFNPGHWP